MITMEENMQRLKIIGIFTVLLLSIVSCQKAEGNNLSLETVNQENEMPQPEIPETIFVHICGAVCKEGVYELPTGSRVFQAIEMAGGFREDAAVSEVNQAELLEDASRIYIPTTAELMETQSKGDGKININKVSKEELMTLPGVGESKENSIIQYRTEQGAFKRIEDIMQISGIKEALFHKICDLIKV